METTMNKRIITLVLLMSCISNLKPVERDYLKPVERDLDLIAIGSGISTGLLTGLIVNLFTIDQPDYPHAPILVSIFYGCVVGSATCYFVDNYRHAKKILERIKEIDNLAHRIVDANEILSFSESDAYLTTTFSTEEEFSKQVTYNFGKQNNSLRLCEQHLFTIQSKLHNALAVYSEAIEFLKTNEAMKFFEQHKDEMEKALEIELLKKDEALKIYGKNVNVLKEKSIIIDDLQYYVYNLKRFNEAKDKISLIQADSLLSQNISSHEYLGNHVVARFGTNYSLVRAREHLTHLTSQVENPTQLINQVYNVAKDRVDFGGNFLKKCAALQSALTESLKNIESKISLLLSHPDYQRHVDLHAEHIRIEEYNRQKEIDRKHEREQRELDRKHEREQRERDIRHEREQRERDREEARRRRDRERKKEKKDT